MKAATWRRSAVIMAVITQCSPCKWKQIICIYPDCGWRQLFFLRLVLVNVGEKIHFHPIRFSLEVEFVPVTLQRLRVYISNSSTLCDSAAERKRLWWLESSFPDSVSRSEGLWRIHIKLTQWWGRSSLAHHGAAVKNHTNMSDPDRGGSTSEDKTYHKSASEEQEAIC